MALLGVGATFAQADSITEFNIDIYHVSIAAYDPTGTSPMAFSGSSFTGQLKFSENLTTTMGLLIDETLPEDYSGSITSIDGDIALTGGFISGGTITISVAKGVLTDSYSFDLVPNAYQISNSIGLGWELSGYTSNGNFDNNNFAGVDVSTWYDQQPVPGTFLELFYRPNSVGLDNGAWLNVNANATINPLGGPTAPLPSAAYSGLVGAGILGVYQWRRNRRLKRAN